MFANCSSLSKRELKEVSEKIKGTSDIKKYEEKYQDAVAQLDRFKEHLGNNHDAIIRLNTQISENEKEG